MATPFSECFAAVRSKRRIPMRVFAEYADINPSYIHEVEKGDLLPGAEKLDLICEVFRRVAIEQGAADPDSDTPELRETREQTYCMTRLGVNRDVARLVVVVRDADPEISAATSRAAVAVLGLLGEVSKPIQIRSADKLVELLEPLEVLEPDARERAIMVLGNLLGESIRQAAKANEDLFELEIPPAPAVAKKRRERSRVPAE